MTETEIELMSSLTGELLTLLKRADAHQLRMHYGSDDEGNDRRTASRNHRQTGLQIEPKSKRHRSRSHRQQDNHVRGAKASGRTRLERGRRLGQGSLILEFLGLAHDGSCTLFASPTHNESLTHQDSISQGRRNEAGRTYPQLSARG